MPENSTENNKPTASPSERVAKFILSFCKGVKTFFEMIVYSSGARPQGRIVRHRGKALPPGRNLRFPGIMVVDDNMNIASDMANAARRHYTHGKVDIYLAYGLDTAMAYFQRENIGLVIMDNDLDDDRGDGVFLTAKFKAAKPGLTILANSSSTVSNNKLIDAGAREEPLNKNWKRLSRGLENNDPMGQEEQ